jgi:hypothetical protein
VIEYAGNPLMAALALAIDPPDATRAAFARTVSSGVLEGYRCGELDLRGALQVVHRAAAGSGAVARAEIIADFATRALQIGKPKSLNRSRPPYAKWLKALAVDLVLSLRDAAPYLPSPPEQSTRLQVIALLDSLGLLPSKNGSEGLPERTLHKWCLDRRRETGKSQRRGRTRKKK